jgi:hypothetical protein
MDVERQANIAAALADNQAVLDILHQLTPEHQIALRVWEPEARKRRLEAERLSARPIEA